MNKMSPLDIAWLAGLMEGEATIGGWKTNSYAKTRKFNKSLDTKYARVELSSTDKEILEKILELTGVGYICLHYGSKTKKKDTHKQSWTWRVGKAEDVLHLLCTVASFQRFSEHRREQILDTVEAASAVAMRKRSGESYRRKEN